MNEELVKYIEERYFPIYKFLDDHHATKHINDVIRRSFELKSDAKLDDLDDNIIYASAALHDIGRIYGKKDHNINSMKVVLKDVNLPKFFTEEEIKIIAGAVRDHSKSVKTEPETIYGKVLSDADKELNVDDLLLRTYESIENKNSDVGDQDELFIQTHKRLNKMYGSKGKVNFYIDSPKHTYFLKEVKPVIEDHDLYIDRLTNVLEKSNKSTQTKQLVKEM